MRESLSCRGSQAALCHRGRHMGRSAISIEAPPKAGKDVTGFRRGGEGVEG